MGAIYLIRHGQASFGADDYDKLSATGVEQARVLGQSLAQRGVKPDRIICGGMLRHRETAQAALTELGVPAQWDNDAGWNEYDHVAIIAGHTPRWRDQVAMKLELAKLPNPRRAFQQVFEEAIERWVSGQHHDDYPESWAGFSARVSGALTKLHESLGKSQTALVFTSGGAISAVAQRMLHLDDRNTFRLNWIIANAGLTKLIYSERGLYLSALNDHAHFEGAHSRLITYR